MLLPFARAVAVTALTLSTWSHVPAACATPAGEVIFEAKCAACHSGGGNVLQPGKTLFRPALEKNGYSTVDSITELVRNGKGQMPKYQGAIPAVSRLSDEDLAAVAQWVSEQADGGWKS